MAVVHAERDVAGAEETLFALDGADAPHDATSVEADEAAISCEDDTRPVGHGRGHGELEGELVEDLAVVQVDDLGELPYGDDEDRAGAREARVASALELDLPEGLAGGGVEGLDELVARDDDGRALGGLAVHGGEGTRGRDEEQPFEDGRAAK